MQQGWIISQSSFQRKCGAKELFTSCDFRYFIQGDGTLDRHLLLNSVKSTFLVGLTVW